MNMFQQRLGSSGLVSVWGHYAHAALTLRLSVLVGCICLVFGCVSSEIGDAPGSPSDEPAPPKVEALSDVRTTVPRQLKTPKGPSEAESNAPPSRQQVEVFRGTGKFTARVEPSTTRKLPKDLGEEPVRLSFSNAEIKEVARAVLGELLKLNYEVDSKVQGVVTIETNQPLKKRDILPVFEQALSLNGYTLLYRNNIYQVVRSEDAGRHNLIAGPSSTMQRIPGYGVEVVPLKYVSATEMQRLIAPLMAAKDAVSVDPTRNLLFVRGSQPDRASILENVALFDVNWMQGMSFALFSPNYTNAQTLIGELEQIISGEAGPMGDLVRFVPIERLNSILMITQQPSYLADLERWLQRLDRPGRGSGRQMHVYHVQNGRAADLAKVLNTALKKDKPSAANSDTVQPVALSDPLGAEGIDVDGVSGFSVSADDTNNALIIVATPQEYEIIQAALRELDLEPLQVLMEAAIAEVTLTDDLRYGVQFFFQQSDKLDIVLSAGSSAAIGPTFPGLAYIFDNGSDIQAVLDAIASVTQVEVLSSPQILVLNNQTATLQVGNQVPIITQQSVSTANADSPIVNSVQYQDTGVILKVTPRVNQGGLVMLDISQEVSDVLQTSTSGIDSPTFQQRKIESTVAIQANETIALAGLISSKVSDGRSGVPVLQSVPGLGALFRSTDKATTKTELIVLITPRIVNSVERARSVTEELRQRLRYVEPLLSNKAEQ